MTVTLTSKVKYMEDAAYEGLFLWAALFLQAAVDDGVYDVVDRGPIADL